MRSEAACPQGWRTFTLGDLVNLQKGRKVDTTEVQTNGSIPYLGAADFASKPTRWTTSDKVIACTEKDTLLLWDGERSGLSAYGLSGAVSSTVVRLRPKNGNVDSGFLYLAIHDAFEWIQQLRTGSGIPHVPKDLHKRLNIWLPPLAEQRKIAAILTSVDEALQATEAVIAQTRRVKEGLLQELLTKGIGHTRFKQTEIGEIPETWEVRTLAKAVDPTRPITYGIVQTGVNKADGVPCVRVVDLVQDKIGIKEMIRTTEEISRSYRRTVLRQGDIMLALRGEIGHVRIVEDDLIGANLTRGIALIAPSESYDPKFLLWTMRSPAVREGLLKRVNGSALKEIPLGELRKVSVPCPPINEQSKIARIMNSVSDAEVRKTAALSLLRHLKSGLLQDLLTGRVRVDVSS